MTIDFKKMMDLIALKCQLIMCTQNMKKSLLELNVIQGQKGEKWSRMWMKNPNTSLMTWFVKKGNGKGNWGSKIIEHNWTRYHILWWIISRLIRQYHYFLLSMLQMSRWAFWKGLNAQCIKSLEKEENLVKANNI